MAMLVFIPSVKITLCHILQVADGVEIVTRQFSFWMQALLAMIFIKNRGLCEISLRIPLRESHYDRKMISL